MSISGSPIDTSLVQAAQAQQTASKTRDREKALTERTQRYADQLELRVAGMESSEALRQFPENDSEQAGAEHEAKGQHEPPVVDADRPKIDIKA